MLLRPGGNHTVGARVRDRLPEMLVLIFENQHQRVLLGHVFSEQFHGRLQVVVGKSRNRFLQIGVRSFQSVLADQQTARSIASTMRTRVFNANSAVEW